MDDRLVTWARSVKARAVKGGGRQRGWGRGPGPVLWLFTDAVRLPDPCPAVASLPAGLRNPGLFGVVFRHDGTPGRAALARALARLCRQRRIALSVAGDWRLAALLGAGIHLRGGVRPPAGGGMRPPPRGGFCTASAHDMAQLVAARRAGAAAFLSPMLPTASHPGGQALGVVRWAGLARRAGGRVLALGGVDGISARRLPGSACGAGAIGALGAGDRSR